MMDEQKYDRVAVDKFWEMIATNLVHELEPILSIKEVTANPDLLGAYAESAIRRLIRRTVHPMHVSTGAILEYPLPNPLKQLDAIVWAAAPIPGLFAVDEFALVPESSAAGMLEIKRSNYSQKVTEGIENLISYAAAFASKPAPFDSFHRPQLVGYYPGLPAMGVVCVLTEKPSARLQALIDQERAVAIFEAPAAPGERPTVRKRDIVHLINFLNVTKSRMRQQEEIVPQSPLPPDLIA